MTGDLILNLSRTPQSSGLLPAQARKVDSLRDSPVRSLKRKNGTAPKAIYDSSPSESSSPSLSDIAAHQDNVESNNNNNRKNCKLSKMITSSGDARLNSISNSVDEEEEQLIMDHGSSSNEPSMSEGRKMKFNLINSGCANNTSSSSSSGSSPTNTNSSNSSPNNNENYDGGGSDIDHVGSSHGSHKAQKYSVLQNEELNQQQKQLKQQTLEERKHLNFTPSASMSSTTTTSSASTTINRSETLHTPTPDVSHSVPTSPTSLSTPLLDAAKRRELASSVPTSPECLQQEVSRRNSGNSHNQQQNGIHVRKNDASGFRTSRSEDHLQLSQRDNAMGHAIPIDIDEDVNSSLNTLLDTRHDSDDSPNSDRDRIVWTYNAPVAQSSNNSNQVVVSPTSHSSSISTSPQHTDSPASPTSVSSSVMSSSGSKGNGLSHTANGGVQGLMFLSGEQSVSEAISNISSPDYQDEHDLLSARDLSAAMAISDPSDSDSTLIVDNPKQDKDHKVVIQVAANGGNGNAHKDSEDELATLTEDTMLMLMAMGHQRESSPPISEDGSDVESLHSFHYSPKAVDIPSAVRLAKRLFHLDGFKKSDVSRHLSKK